MYGWNNGTQYLNANFIDLNKNGNFNFSTHDNTITTTYDANSRILTVTGSTENIFTLFNVLYIN